MLKYNSSWHVYELDALTTVQVMARQAYIHQEGTKCKLDMARTIASHARINYNITGKIANKLTICPDSQSSKSRARLTQARVLHNFKQRHGWIEHYNINKISLLIILKRGTDH